MRPVIAKLLLGGLIAFLLLSFSMSTFSESKVKIWDFSKHEAPAYEYYDDSWDTLRVGSPNTSREVMSWGYALNLENDTMKYVHPNFGELSSPYGMREGKLHKGIDIVVPFNDPIYCCFDGVVRVKGYHPDGYGNFVVIRHFNGLESVYGHLSKPTSLQQNEIVKAGQAIAHGGNTGGSTGAHLHFELRFLGKPFNPAFLVNLDNYMLKKDSVVIDHTWFDW